MDLSESEDGLVGPEPTAASDGTSPNDVAKNIVQGKDDGVKTNSEAVIEQADKPLPAPAPKSRIGAVNVERSIAAGRSVKKTSIKRKHDLC